VAVIVAMSPAAAAVVVMICDAKYCVYPFVVNVAVGDGSHGPVVEKDTLVLEPIAIGAGV
jgi:hypothetical protein